MMGQTAQDWLLPATFPKWEDGVGVQLPKREQENPPGELHPKDAKWLCTGLAVFPPAWQAAALRTAPLLLWKHHLRDPQFYFLSRWWSRGWASGLGETTQPQTWDWTPGGTSSLEQPAWQTREDTRRPSLQSFISLTPIISVSPTDQAVRSNGVAWKLPCREKKIFFPLKKKIFLLSAHWHRGKRKWLQLKYERTLYN